MTKLRSLYTGMEWDGATATRYPNLHVWHQPKVGWRILATDDLGDTDITSGVYVTKLEALSQLSFVDSYWNGGTP